MSENMTKTTKHTLLRGTSNKHVLYGNIKIDSQSEEFSTIKLTKDGILKHEQPNESFAEHKSLHVEAGKWVMGKQVEYNPFDRTISTIWD
jgi:hypothetical protein